MISNRLMQIIKNEGLSVRSFEEIINVSQSTISKTINTGKDVSGNILKKTLETFPHYNAEWLITGKGKMLKNAENVNELREPEPKYGKGTNEVILELVKQNGDLREEIGRLKNGGKIKAENV